MRKYLIIFFFLMYLPVFAQNTRDISYEQLVDKIRGGLLGQMLGNLNGLPHEMQYIDQPGNVTEYVPALPEGARTDDDTDFEWVYIYIMQQDDVIMIPNEQLSALWQERINKGIWCSNRYARYLMDIGIEPPLTGSIALNPWAEFNISGQFICETFGLLAPGMPQTASRIGLHYTRITIDAEPAQTTQLFDTMIATAFFENDIDKILDSGLAALDPNSQIHAIVSTVREWYRQNPGDWRKTRQLVKDKYTAYHGAMRDKNGYELNTAATIAALLYGQGDFVKTLITAFNFGWDADNVAATAGTVVGVMKGYRWMLAQDWTIVDRYHNTKRDHMPNDETISSFADRLYELAEQVILDAGGSRHRVDGRITYTIPVEQPANIQALPDLVSRTRELTHDTEPFINRIMKSGATATKQERARAAYLTICLGMADSLEELYPENWHKSVDDLSSYWKIMQNIFYDDDIPGIYRIRESALKAGVKKPDAKRDVW